MYFVPRNLDARYVDTDLLKGGISDRWKSSSFGGKGRFRGEEGMARENCDLRES